VEISLLGSERAQGLVLPGLLDRPVLWEGGGRATPW
jgi:hypothetical protein